MVLDIAFVIFLIIFAIAGYKKGLVSTILSLGLIAVSFVLATYVSYHWNFIEIPVFGVWLQTFILFAVFSALSQWLVSAINFEEILLLGFVSKILGAFLYVIIYVVILFVILGVLLYVSPQMLFQYFNNSVLLAWLQELITKIDVSQLELMKFYLKHI